MSFLVVAVAAIMLTGCVTSGPTDLRLVSIGAVNRTTEKQIPGFYEKDGSYIRPDELALNVVFASRVNLIDYAKDDVQIFVHADFCNEALRPPAPTGHWLGLSWSRIYYDDKDVSALHFDLATHKVKDAPKLLTQDNGEIYYHMYVMAYRRSDRYNQEQLFDLTVSPQDVCIKTSISQFLSRRDSNTMKIPANLIKEALHSFL